jgi:tRNA 2-selenouridine synthase
VYLSRVILDLADFLELRDQLPLVDVRSEGEYEQGHILHAINIPILNNSERVVVGTTYKQRGQAEAIRTGFRLVGPRLADIIERTQEVGSEVIVHCWRGGMRSGNFCQFVGMAGVKSHQLRGGYKAYRNLALDALRYPFKFVLLSGHTGSGKSALLNELKSRGEQVLDLEAIAKHKGSVFGGLNMPVQPTTEQFQNEIFESVRTMDPSRRVWVEDESIAIGKIFLPMDLWKTMGSSPIVEIIVDKSARLQRLVSEYENTDSQEFINAMRGIQKKLGGQHFKMAAELVEKRDMYSAIDIILNYYDKAYANGLARKADRVKFKLDWDGISLSDFADYLINKTEVER